MDRNGTPRQVVGPPLRRSSSEAMAALRGSTSFVVCWIRRRPEPERYFREFLVLTDRHRALVPGSDEAVRDALARLPETDWPEFLDERELESLRFGERERVTDMALPHIQDLPRVLPDLFAARQPARSRPASMAWSCTTLTPTPWHRFSPP